MTLLARTTHRARRVATRKAEKRLDEITVVAAVETDYRTVDAAGDLEMEAWFQAAYAAAPNEEWRQRIVIGFLKWERSERREDVAVSGSVEEAVGVLKGNNEFWLHDVDADGTPAA